MRDSSIIVRRHPYEEPYHTQLEILVSNGSFMGSTDFYCGVDDLAEIGAGLKPFPRFVGDEYRYEYGSSDPKVRFYRYFLLRAYTIDRSGHCALQVAMNLNRNEPDEGSCRFSLSCEPWSLTQLAELFLAFSRLEHLEFKWVPGRGIAELYSEYQ